MRIRLFYMLAAAAAAAVLLTACGDGNGEVETTPAMTHAAVQTASAASGDPGTAVEGAGPAEIAAPGSGSAAQSGVKAEAPGAGLPESAKADPSDIQSSSEENDADVVIRIGAMNGPTAMGLVSLMEESADGLTENHYEFLELAAEASAMVGPLSRGSVDIAAIPSNLAAAVYNKTNGGIQVLAVNTLGVLNLVERGNSLKSVKDLAGRMVYATGQSAVPEYVLRYLLTENGIDPDQDLDIRWCSDTTEALSYLKADKNAAAVLPQPFVTAAMAQIEDLRIVQDLNDAWEELEPGCDIVTGVTVVRTEFAREHPAAVSRFLEEYADSVEFVQDDIESAAELVVKYGILPKVPLARKALPGCHIVCITGDEMTEAVDSFLQLIFEQNPAAVGDRMPGNDFYYE